MTFIRLFYQPQSAQIADRQIEAIFLDIEELIQFPMIGRTRDELHLGLRVFGTRGKRLIFYTLRQSKIEVKRILHGHMNIAAVFLEEN